MVRIEGLGVIKTISGWRSTTAVGRIPRANNGWRSFCVCVRVCAGVGVVFKLRNTDMNLQAAVDSAQSRKQQCSRQAEAVDACFGKQARLHAPGRELNE